jgi:HlyD family secretion protein
MSRPRKYAMYGSAVLAIVVAGFWGLQTLDGAAPEFEASRIATVQRGTMVRSVVATGKIEPVTKVEIKSKANGIITVLNVDVDQVVKEGDVLIELDKENLNARLRESRAALEAAEASLAAAEAALKKNVIEAEGPDVEFAQRAYERANSLFEQKLIAQSGLDDAKGAYETALNRQRAAKTQLSVAQARVAEARANVAQTRAAVDRAAEELANATIRAPIEGTILARQVEIGSPVSSILNLGAAATPVITLGDISHVFVRGKVDESDIGRVRLGQSCRITVETFKDRTFQGKVTQISPMGVEKDNVTNFEVKVSIDNPGGELKAMMTANAEIILEEHPDSLIVPEAAIIYDSSRSASVDLIDARTKEGKRRVSVKLGIGNGSKTQVLQGLKTGDRLLLPS